MIRKGKRGVKQEGKEGPRLETERRGEKNLKKGVYEFNGGQGGLNVNVEGEKKDSMW